MTSAETRFWAKTALSPTGCLEWTSSLDTSGYGLFHYMKRLWKAHRFAYLITWGEIPASLIVRHACDNPRCVNPAHLATGTQLDNMRDRDTRGRNARHRGGNGTRKISLTQAAEIKARVAAGERYLTLGREFGVAASTIRYNAHERRVAA